MSEQSFFNRYIGTGILWFTGFAAIGHVFDRYNPPKMRTAPAVNFGMSYLLTVIGAMGDVKIPESLGDSIFNRVGYCVLHAAFMPLPNVINLPIRKKLELK